MILCGLIVLALIPVLVSSNLSSNSPPPPPSLPLLPSQFEPHFSSDSLNSSTFTISKHNSTNDLKIDGVEQEKNSNERNILNLNKTLPFRVNNLNVKGDNSNEDKFHMQSNPTLPIDNLNRLNFQPISNNLNHSINENQNPIGLQPKSFRIDNPSGESLNSKNENFNGPFVSKVGTFNQEVLPLQPNDNTNGVNFLPISENINGPLKVDPANANKNSIPLQSMSLATTPFIKGNSDSGNTNVKTSSSNDQLKTDAKFLNQELLQPFQPNIQTVDNPNNFNAKQQMKQEIPNGPVDTADKNLNEPNLSKIETNQKQGLFNFNNVNIPSNDKQIDSLKEQKVKN